MKFLDKVKEIRTQRATQYEKEGSPPTLTMITKLWNVILGDKLKKPLTEKDVCVLMIQLKMARVVTPKIPTEDTLLDICGYTDMLNDTLKEQLDREFNNQNYDNKKNEEGME